MSMFTAEELAAMAAADDEIEASFGELIQTQIELADWLDDEAIKNTKQKKYQREYYKAHREEKLAYQNKYWADNLEQCRASHRRYYKRNADYCRQRQRERRTENVRKYKKEQRAIREYRKEYGISVNALATSLGVSEGTIRSWESGNNPANWTLLWTVYPDLQPKVEA